MNIKTPRFRRRSYYIEDRKVLKGGDTIVLDDATVVKAPMRNDIHIEVVSKKLIHDGDTWLCTVAYGNGDRIAYGVARKNDFDNRSRKIAKSIALNRALKCIKKLGDKRIYEILFNPGPNAKLNSYGIVNFCNIKDLVEAFNNYEFEKENWR